MTQSIPSDAPTNGESKPSKSLDANDVVRAGGSLDFNSATPIDLNGQPPAPDEPTVAPVSEVDLVPLSADRVKAFVEEMKPHISAYRAKRAAEGGNGAVSAAARAKRSKWKAPGDGWESELTVTARGAVTASAANLLAILRHDAAWDGVLALNERNGQMLWHNAPPWRTSENGSWAQCELCDGDFTRVAAWLETSKFAIPVSPGSKALCGALLVAAEDRRFDPVRLYLDALQWDGTRRLDSLLPVYLGAAGDDDGVVAEYLHAVGARALIAAVARTYVPGCKVDHVLVLVGDQGPGKSTALKILAGGDEYFTDSLPDLNSKDAADHLRGPWFVELAELDSLKRSKLSTYKAFFTRTHDRYRSPYGRVTQNHPRRCVFFASTNEDTFLADVTGNRRFWPVTVRGIDLAALRRDRDQLWAEAVHRYRAGEPWHLDSAPLIAAAAGASEDRQIQDPWRPTIEAQLVGCARVGVHEVLQRLGVELERRDQIAANRVARVLRQLGWTRHQVRDASGRRTWVYCEPTGRS